MGDSHEKWEPLQVDEKQERISELEKQNKEMLHFIGICRTWFLRYNDSGHAQRALELILWVKQNAPIVLHAQKVGAE